MNKTAAETILAPPSSAALEQLEASLQARMNRRIRDFQLLLRGPGLVLRGRAHTYYAKQLAQQAVLEATTLPILANEIQVDS